MEEEISTISVPEKEKPPLQPKINNLMLKVAEPDRPPTPILPPYSKRNKNDLPLTMSIFDQKDMTASQQFFLLTRNFLTAIMPQILSTSSVLLSLIWALAYFVSFAILATQAYLTFNDYYSHPVNVEVSLETSSGSLEFPAVTICNNNMVKRSFISRISHLKELATLSEYVYQMELPETNRDESVLTNLGVFQCTSDTSAWIPRSWVCNGKKDCQDGSDEIAVACEVFKPLNYTKLCLGDWMKCPDESTCAVACDGTEECVAVKGYDESPDAGCEFGTVPPWFVAGSEPLELEPPTHANQYLNNIDENYLIQAPEGHVVKIKITFFDVEYCSHPTCWCDHFKILDGGSEEAPPFAFKDETLLCGRYCDFDDIYSSTNQILVKFYSDNIVRYPGWTLEYMAVPEDEAPATQNKNINYKDDCPQYNSNQSPSYSYIPYFYYYYGWYYDYFNYGYSYIPLDNDYAYDFEKFKDALRNLSPESEEPTNATEPSPVTDHVNGYEFSQFSNIDRFDWFSIYANARMPDFSDFKKFVKLKEEELIGNGHQKEDFIAQCVFDHEICNSTSFRTFQHELFGNCFTFNSIVDARKSGDSGDKAKSTSKVGSENGLALSLFLETDEFVGSIGHYSGARIVVHNADEFPPMSTKGIEISAGTATTLALRQETILRETDPFSDCAEEWPLFLELNSNYRKYRYTLEFCIYLCKQKSLAESCGCSDTFDWNFSRNLDVRKWAKVDCDVWNSTEYACLQTVYNEFAEGKRTCDCPNPCEERLLRAFSSATSWPSLSYTPHLVSLLKDSSSATIRKFISTQISETDGKSDREKLQQSIKDNFARVQIYFESMVYTRIKESPKYNLSTLFGTIGGNLGLWLGWSLLSLFEFLQWFSMSSAIVVGRAGRYGTTNGEIEEIN